MSRMERSRLQAGLTLEDVAGRLARNPITVRRRERGEHLPSQSNLIRLAGYYGVPTSELTR